MKDQSFPFRRTVYLRKAECGTVEGSSNSKLAATETRKLLSCIKVFEDIYTYVYRSCRIECAYTGHTLNSLLEEKGETATRFLVLMLRNTSHQSLLV